MSLQQAVTAPSRDKKSNRLSEDPQEDKKSNRLSQESAEHDKKPHRLSEDSEEEVTFLPDNMTDERNQERSQVKIPNPPKLVTGEHFPVWKRTFILHVENYYSHVICGLPELDDDLDLENHEPWSLETKASNDADLKTMSKANKLLASVLTGALSPELLGDLAHVEIRNGYELFRSLCRIFEGKTLTEQSFMWNQYVNSKPKRQEPMRAYIRRVAALRRALLPYDNFHPGNEMMLRSVILHSLPEAYSTLVASLYSKPAAYKLSELVTDLTALQHQVEGFNSGDNFPDRRNRRDDSALLGQERKCRRCDGKCTMRNGRCTNVCTYCSKAGHGLASCWTKQRDERNKRGTPDRSNNTRDKTKVGHTRRNSDGLSEWCFMAGSLASAPVAQPGNWILDSGATRHYCRERQSFDTLEPDQGEVRLGDDRVTHSEGIGTVGELKEVKYTPGMASNLLSVSKLVADGQAVVFDKDGAYILDGNNSTKLKQLNMARIAVHRDNLYIHERKVNKAQAQAYLWHCKMNHAPLSTLVTAAKKGHIVGLPDDLKANSLEFCKICALAKSTRKAFPKTAEHRATRPLQKIYMDVCGAITPTSDGDHKYLLVICDEFSHSGWAIPLRKKSHTLRAFDQFRKQAEAELAVHQQDFRVEQVRTKSVRTDGGGEFTSGEFEQYCLDHRIHHELTVPHSSQQNGMAERLIRDINQKVRVLVSQSGLRTMWHYAARTACYVRDRTPMSANPDHKTPYEMRTGTAPKVQHLQVFGTKCYVNLNEAERPRGHKFSAKSTEAVFVGYSSCSTGYLVMVNNKVLVRRDVDFDNRRIMRDAANLVDDRGTRHDFIPEVMPALVSGSEDESSDDDDDDLQAHEDEVKYDHEKKEESPSVLIADDDDCAEEKKVPVVFADDMTYMVTSSTEHRCSGVHCCTSAAEAAATLYAQAVREYAFTVTEAAGVDVPRTYKAALNSEQASQWIEAIRKELSSMTDNQVWEVVPRTTMPTGRKAITSTWTFRVKQGANGHILRYKARLCARGFQQVAGQDYHDTFAPVARLTTFRALMARGAQRDYDMTHADIETAFLHGELKEDIYMEVPQGVDLPDGAVRSDYVLKLRKSIYGLKQAPRVWNKKLHAKLLELGFERTDADPCLYKLKGAEVYLLCYVDDLVLCHPRNFDLSDVLDGLRTVFRIGTVEPLQYFLGFEIHRRRDRRLIKVHQRRFVLDMLTRFGLADCNPVATPCTVGAQAYNEGTPLDAETSSLYRTMVGSLLWVAMGTRPDIAHAVTMLTRHMQSPTDLALKGAKRVLRYLRGEPGTALVYGGSPCRLTGQCDASWANCTNTRRSYSGYLFSLSNGGAICWSSKLQRTPALSSTEAEYMACSATAQEAVWLRRLVKSLGMVVDEPTLICQDNMGAQALTQDTVYHSRTKHIDVRHHYVRQLVEDKVVQFQHTPGTDLTADVFTKALCSPTFKKHLSVLFGDQHF